MADELFPKEIIDHAAESNFSKHSVRSKLIYCMVLIGIILSLLVLPFIYTDVSVKSQGIIKPLTERNPLISLRPGKIKKLYIHNNMPVHKGEIVAKIEAPLIREKQAFNIQRIEKVKQYLHDLQTLQKVDSTSLFHPVALHTIKYRQSLQAFRQKMHNSLQKIKEATLSYSRTKTLFDREVSSRATYEKSLFQLKTAQNAFQLLLKQQINKWQADQIDYREELKKLKNQKHQLVKQLDQYIIKAPVAGTIQNMIGMYPGSYVSTNEKLAEISPDTGLTAECYISPKDIGLLRKGMKARFQISAFNFHQWGFLNGKIEEISDDVTMMQDRPIFKVRCRLNQKYLSLQNGYKGKLKKGMTLQARFQITRRNLFQLLYDNIDDWLNPKWGKEFIQDQRASL